MGTQITIIVLTATITFWLSMLYIGKKIDILTKQIERRNNRESERRSLFRYDD